MRDFNYSSIKNKKWDSELLALIAAIYKEAGKQEMFLRQRPKELEKLVEIVNDFQKKGLRVRTENIENLGKKDFEIFNFDEKYVFQNGELKKEE